MSRGLIDHGHLHFPFHTSSTLGCPVYLKLKEERPVQCPRGKRDAKTTPAVHRAGAAWLAAFDGQSRDATRRTWLNLNVLKDPISAWYRSAHRCPGPPLPPVADSQGTIFNIDKVTQGPVFLPPHKGGARGWTVWQDAGASGACPGCYAMQAKQFARAGGKGLRTTKPTRGHAAVCAYGQRRYSAYTCLFFRCLCLGLVDYGSHLAPVGGVRLPRW